MKKLSIILLLAGVLLFMEGTVTACWCGELANFTPEQIRKRQTEEADWAEVIFSGEVVSIDRFKVKFKVDEVWKGKHQDEITMSTGARLTQEGRIKITSCDYKFIVGEKYVVFAKMIEGELQTYQCTGTMVLKNAEARIEFLNEMQRKKKQSD